MEWFERATAASECGALARRVRWADTPLGTPATWPSALRVATEMCLTTSFPMLVVWGPDLTEIYNDAYAVILGEGKHPRAMGAPAQSIWPEIWSQVGPLFHAVLQSGEPIYQRDQRLLIERNGILEETYFTYSFSPLRDDEGAIRGVLDTVTETTEHVIDRRRLANLGRLSSNLHVTDPDVVEVCRMAVTTLIGQSEDVRACDVHLAPDGDLVLVSSTRGLAGQGDEELRRQAQAVFASTEPFIGEALLISPLIVPGDEGPAGVIVLEANQLRPFDDAYVSFLTLVASTIATVVSGAFRWEQKLGELRRTGQVLQMAMLPDVRAAGVVGRYIPAQGNLVVGGDWYDVIRLPGDRVAILIGDCVGNGLSAAAVMGQLRTAARTLLLEGHGPLSTIQGLDRFAQGLPGAESATVFCGIVDHEVGTITYSSAGHPPPLVDCRGELRWLEGPRDVPLATFEIERHETSSPFGAGDYLVLYTDGLVERRGEDLDAGLDRLWRETARLRQADLEILADDLVQCLLPDAVVDDVALLLYRR
jgi:hypothetical protein